MRPPETTGHRTHSTRSAVPTESEEVVELCLAAFADEAVTAWMLPDPIARAAAMGQMFRGSLAEAIDAGALILAIGADERPIAASTWVPRSGDPQSEGPERGERAEEPEKGARAERGEEPSGGIALDHQLSSRLRAVERATAARQPTVPHLHLASMAVLPSHRGLGVGGALITAGLSRASELGLPVHLEASTPGSRELYRRYGFHDHGGPITLPEGGPSLQPMWRDV